MTRHLTLTQKRILERIVEKEHGATTAQIQFALYGAYGQEARGPNNIAVQIAKIRPWLASEGIHIMTADKFSGCARYFICYDDRPRARAFIAAEAHRLAEPIKVREFA